MLNHEILGESAADIHRPDLAAAGLGDGNAGYVIRLFRPIDPLYLPFIVVKVDRGDVELPRAPMLGFGEFFATLFATHPAAGRPRSVFGGLWTDRTDAAALLRGKTAIGQIPEAIGPAIGRLIHDGFAMVELSAIPSEYAWQQDLAEPVGNMLEDAALLSLLQLVLEDNPLVVKAEWTHEGATELAQPSAANPSPSLAECLELVVAFGDGAVLDVVRASHGLPEFTPYGVSRWASGTASDGLSMAGINGMVDRQVLETAKVAVMGPGTLYRVRCKAGAAAVRLLCLAERGLPLALVTDNTRTVSIRESGVHIRIVGTNGQR